MTDTYDLYFLRIAKVVSENSKCLSRKIGAVLVKDNTIISTGYNGPSKGVKHCNQRNKKFYNSLFTIEGSDIDFDLYDYDENKCPRRNYSFSSGEGLFMCQAGHAERNTLIQAARNGISTLGSTLYCYCPLPCKDCCIEIINAGVKAIVYLSGKDYDLYSRVILNEAKIDLKQISIDKIMKGD